MAKERLVQAGLALLLAMVFWSGCAIRASHADLGAYTKTLRGLNEDLRASLEKIRAQQDVEANMELLHDQLHLMRNILHLVSEEKRNGPPFSTLHDLNHEMRDRWHDVKKGREPEANLGKLDEQLRRMKEQLEQLGS